MDIKDLSFSVQSRPTFKGDKLLTRLQVSNISRQYIIKDLVVSVYSRLIAKGNASLHIHKC